MNMETHIGEEKKNRMRVMCKNEHFTITQHIMQDNIRWAFGFVCTNTDSTHHIPYR